jgi:hypothetical protein
LSLAGWIQLSANKIYIVLPSMSRYRKWPWEFSNKYFNRHFLKNESSIQLNLRGVALVAQTISDEEYSLTKFWITVVSPASRYFLTLMSKCSPERFVLNTLRVFCLPDSESSFMPMEWAL